MPSPSQAAGASVVPVLALEGTLSAAGGRTDERVGLLLRALEDPAVADEARVRLRTIVVDAPPRSAWEDAYEAALVVPGAPTGPVEIRAAAAALQVPDAGPAAWTTLETLARADVPDARQQWGQAVLFHGRFGGAEHTALLSPLHRAWVGVAQGDASLALGTLTAPDAQPCLSTNDPLPCGGLLLDLGWPGAALVRVRSALDEAPDDAALQALAARAEQALHRRPDPALRAVAEQADTLRGAGHAAEALALLVGAAATSPSAWEVLGPGLGLAFELDQPSTAIALLQAALAHERRPQGWRSMLADLGAVTAAAAESWKAAGQLHEALQALQLAHVLVPLEPGILRSLGGTSWQLGQPEAALVAYAAAETLAPGDPGVLQARFRLLLQLDRLDQARDLLVPLPVGDPTVDALRQELSIEASVRSVQAQLSAGDVDGALESSALLLSRFGDWSRIQATHGDVLLAAGRPRDAAAAFERARLGDPENPWLAASEARALGELGLWREAHGLLDGLDTGAGTELASVVGALREGLLRAEGDALRVSGDWEAAWAHYDTLLSGTPDAWTLTGAGALYLAAGRPDEAMAAYDRALALDPTNPVPARGRVWALLGQGHVRDAEDAAQALVDGARDPANDALLDHARRQRLLHEALVLRFSQRPSEAEALLVGALEEFPHDDDLTLALGWLHDQQDRAGDAWWLARAVLQRDPTHLDALRLLRVVGHGRAGAVHRAWQEAADAGADPAVARSLPALRLAIELERAQEMASRGLKASARDIVTQASKDLAGGDGQAWLAVGDAWMALGDLDRAWAAYELGVAHAPQDGEAVRRLAGCLEARGRSAHAQRVLERAWDSDQDPRVGLALAELQERRGLLRQGAETRRALVTAASRRLDTDSMPAAEEAPPAPASVSTTVGFGWLARPGFEGTSKLTGWTVPVGAAAALPGRWQLEVQAVPHQLSDGATTVRGATLSAGVATRPGGALSARARVGTGPVGSAPTGRWTWDLTAGAGLGDRGEVALGVHRAPVLGSLASWSGAQDILDRPYGAVSDTWVSGLLSLRWPPGADLGLVVRAGAMAGEGVEPVTWQQAAAWAHRPVAATGDKVRVGLEGVAFAHDHKSDRFIGGEAAAFTPERFGQLSARVEGTWRFAGLPVQVCGAAGAGPQYQDGRTLRFEDPGWALTTDGVLAAQWRFDPDWLVEGRFYAQATSTRWHQEVALVTLQRLAQVTVAVPPSAPFSSPVHGPPVVPHRPCNTVSWEADR